MVERNQKRETTSTVFFRDRENREAEIGKGKLAPSAAPCQPSSPAARREHIIQIDELQSHCQLNKLLNSALKNTMKTPYFSITS
ncbi:hypothetical protein L1987_55932 [Smallanthus sonchifolius]|uniref:Uncharacterized protein n=1 Tax=Smallanthus sonchifolius TaxID=185202 RepID=A0ACB9EC21_9ASTR|nr:hypothetical protein L1987_55932 [Smallanthus sonchifolius]